MGSDTNCNTRLGQCSVFVAWNKGFSVVVIWARGGFWRGGRGLVPGVVVYLQVFWASVAKQRLQQPPGFSVR